MATSWKVFIRSWVYGTKQSPRSPGKIRGRSASFRLISEIAEQAPLPPNPAPTNKQGISPNEAVFPLRTLKQGKPTIWSSPYIANSRFDRSRSHILLTENTLTGTDNQIHEFSNAYRELLQVYFTLGLQSRSPFTSLRWRIAGHTRILSSKAGDIS